MLSVQVLPELLGQPAAKGVASMVGGGDAGGDRGLCELGSRGEHGGVDDAGAGHEGRHGISFWDALTVQAAGSSGAEVIYSEDLADGQSYVEVRVINPLK
jgi:hypothetical protein